LTPPPHAERTLYARRFTDLEQSFAAACVDPRAGQAAIAARALAVDALVASAWDQIAGEGEAFSGKGLALLAVGGYGRAELFPYSDVDLMILLDSGFPEKLAAEPIQRLNQLLWDGGLRVSVLTRTLADCERFDPDNVEFSLALLDARRLAGDAQLSRELLEQTIPRLIERERKRFITRMLDVTRKRHQRFGGTLFHLEPNVKECPGGLRDAHVCAWLARLDDPQEGLLQLQAALFSERDAPGFAEARAFLVNLRTFLHFRHRRDDSVLDWQSQDAAAAARLGTGTRDAQHGAPPPDASLWMRLYFRHARILAQRLAQVSEGRSSRTVRSASPAISRLRGLNAVRRLSAAASGPAGRARTPATFHVRHGQILFADPAPSGLARGADPAADPETAFAIFAEMATSGARLPASTEVRLADAFPALAARLEDGPLVWRYLARILTGYFSGRALRAMHALGILELLIPEFHGIDALVIRDAYHRYTVDEHTFVVLDTLHALETHVAADPPSGVDQTALRLGKVFRDLRHPELLMLAALLHDTGKGHATVGHAEESTRLAANVLRRLELDAYESGIVLDLIRNHLEMSAALRRDVFDQETVRSFAVHVATPEALRMLTLFTYADISAVHPGALSSWKAENLWLLHMATLNFLDRNVDEQRVRRALVLAEPDGQSREGKPADAGQRELAEKVVRVRTLVELSLPASAEARLSLTAAFDRFLEGLPRRYLETRTPEQVIRHFRMAARLSDSAREPRSDDVAAGRLDLELSLAQGVTELTLVTFDRPRLFAVIAGALAKWRMDIITADAFSNAHGVVVDSFRFVDRFKTLELNESERERFVQDLRVIVAGMPATADACGEVPVAPQAVLFAETRRRGRRRAPKVNVKPRIAIDQTASSHSTIVEVVAPDEPGLLRALAQTMAEQRCNIEVALVDTEGETAIDVFYLTRSGAKLDEAAAAELSAALLRAIAENAV
jgi:[protein-PII] uridylyltransferase